jgi:hypothetical protein
MRMPFGKHRGEELETIPDSYLWWVLENADNASPILLAAIRKQLGVAEETPKQQQQTKAIVGAVMKRDVESAVASVVRQMSMKYHPDRSGTIAQMQVVNEMAAQLRVALSTVQEAR